MKNNVTQMMYQNAFMNLSNGVINPVDKEILSYSPLPDNVIDPYVKQSVDALQTMNMTNSALNAWVEESQKASYFTKHFVTLSRMIMSGVSTMARGLMTLHMRGEDLDQAPLSIQDLLNISSYQFRKSYLGVLQTVKSHPEISERLLLNQLGWNNTLLKLFRTKEKLAREIRIQKSDIRKIESPEGHADNPAAALPAHQGIDAFLPASSGLSLSEPSALSEPGAYSALRAYSPFGEKTSEIRNKKLEFRNAAENGLPGSGSKAAADRDWCEAPVPQDEEKSEKIDADEASENLTSDFTDNMDENQEPEEDEAFESRMNETNREPSCSASGFGAENNSLQFQLDPNHPPGFHRVLRQADSRGSGPERTMPFTLDDIYQMSNEPEWPEISERL